MTISQICRLSREVERNELLTTVYLDRVYEAETKEADSAFVLRVTFPTEPIRLLTQQVTEKLRGKTTKGGVVVRGAYGSGKSHTLLTLFHLCQNPSEANAWCQRWQLPFRFPDKVRVAAVQLVAEKPDTLWELLFERLDETELLAQVREYPTRDQWATLGRQQPTVLLIDELEAWYEGLSASEKPIQRNALQNLMEAAELSDLPLVVAASVYGTNDEVMGVLNRTLPLMLDVGTAEDRWKIVRHRLLDDLDEAKADEVIGEYLKAYERVRELLPTTRDFDSLRKEMRLNYPFHPHFLRKASEVYSLMPRHEATRGVVGLCATLLRRWAKERDLLLAGDLVLTEEEIASDLRKLSPTLVENALNDLQERCRSLPYSSEFLGAALLYSIGGQKGISDEEFWLATLRPERNINDLQDALNEVYQAARYLDRQNGFWLVTVEESLEKRIEQEARQLVAMPDGRTKVGEWLKERVREKMDREVILYPEEPVQSGGTHLRYVIALEPVKEDAETLCSLLPDNTVLLLTPLPSVTKPILQDDEWLMAAARVIVCEGLLHQKAKRQQDIKRLKGGYEQQVEKLFQTHFAHWLRLSRTNELGEEPKFVVRREKVSLSRTEIEEHLRETFDLTTFKDGVARILRHQGRQGQKGSETAGLTFKQLQDWLRRERGLPILGAPTHQAFMDALKAMLEEESEHTGIVLQAGKSIFGYPPNLVPPEHWQDSWRLWLKAFGPEPPAPKDVKAKVRAALQHAQSDGLTVAEIGRKADGVSINEVKRAIQELVNDGEAVLEFNEERYPDDGYLPTDKVQSSAQVWLKEFAPPDDRKARKEMERLVQDAGEDGISWGEVKSRLQAIGCSNEAIERALQRLWLERKQIVIVNEKGQTVQESVAVPAEMMRLKMPISYRPPTPSGAVPAHFSIPSYRLPDSIDLWLGELRNKLGEDVQVHSVTFKGFPSLCEDDALRKAAKVTERYEVRWDFDPPASKEELLRYCERWAKGLPDAFTMPVETEISGQKQSE